MKTCKNCGVIFDENIAFKKKYKFDEVGWYIYASVCPVCHEVEKINDGDDHAFTKDELREFYNIKH